MEVTRPQVSSDLTDRIGESILEPHFEEARNAIGALLMHIDDLGINQPRQRLMRILKYLDGLRRSVEKRQSKDIEGKLAQVMQYVHSAGLPGPTGAKTRLMVRLDEVFREHTNLNESQRLEHIHRLLRHFDIEKDPEPKGDEDRDVWAYQGQQRIGKAIARERRREKESNENQSG